VLDVDVLTGVIDARYTAKHRPDHDDLAAGLWALKVRLCSLVHG
jgi:hypothetical protein